MTISNESLPAWLSDFEVVHGAEEETTTRTELDELLKETASKTFREGEVFS